MPTQNRSVRGRTVTKMPDKSKATESIHGRAQSWWRPSRAWEARVECWWQGRVARKCKSLQWGKQQQQQQQPTSQKPPGGSPKQSTIAASFFEFTKVAKEVNLAKGNSHQKRAKTSLKKWLRKCYDITFIPDIFLYIVTISTFNKHHGWCWKHIKG